MIMGAMWALAAMLALPIHIKAIPPLPEPKPVKWVLMAVIPKADIFQYEFPSLGGCKDGVEELKKLVPNAYYLCVRTGE
jgi:hypothetical protein